VSSGSFVPAGFPIPDRLWAITIQPAKTPPSFRAYCHGLKLQ
jgi:hypothetical protein